MVPVSGDIAFSGKADEYSKARDWLREICHKLDCSEEAIWVIPGNHDVDREAFRKSTFIQDKHQKLRTGDRREGRTEHELLRFTRIRLSRLSTGRSRYIKFAGGYACKPKPGLLYWEDDLPLSDGSKLRIRGCNSAIASRGSPPDDENANRLVVGRQQTLPPNEDGVMYLLMCHHPLDWLHEIGRRGEGQPGGSNAGRSRSGINTSQRVERVEDVADGDGGRRPPGQE